MKGNRFRILATTVNEKNEDNVELVSVKGKTGYTAGYGDHEFISKLPSYQFPFLPKDKKNTVHFKSAVTLCFRYATGLRLPVIKRTTFTEMICD